MRYLAIFSFAFAGGALLANYLLPASWLIPAAAVLCPLFLWGLKSRRHSARRCALFAAGLAAALGWTALYTAVFVRPAEELDGRTERLTAVVLDYPKRERWDWSVSVRIRTEGAVTIPALLYVDERGEGLRPGDEITAVTHCTLARRTFSGEEITYFTAKGIFLRGECHGAPEIHRPEHPGPRHWPALLARQLKEGIATAFPGDRAALVQALVTGNREKLSDPFTSSLQRAGLSHTVAVSGMHMAFLAGLLSLLLGRGKRHTAVILIPTVLLFMLVTGSTPSVVRASVMILLLQLAPLFDRERDGPTALGFALLLILIHNPFAAAHIGLQLSFAAVAGIFLCSDRIQNFLLAWRKGAPPRRFTLSWAAGGAIRFFASVCSATLGAMVLTTPLVALYFGSVSLVSLLANLLTLWAVSFVFLGGLLAGLVGALVPPLGGVLADVVGPLVDYLNEMIPWLADLPFAALSMESVYYRLWLVFVYTLLALTVFIKGKKRPWLPLGAAALTLALAITLTVRTFHMGDMAVAVLDVGQGQSVLVRSGDYLTLVDCGGDRSKGPGDVAADCIQGLGRDELNLLVVSHFHADHANGIPQLMERVHVSAVAIPDVEEESELRQRILEKAEEEGSEVWFIRQDEIVSLGEEQQITLYAPLGKGDTNEEGLTVLATAGDFDVLLTGDMGGDVEQKLLKHAQLPDIELLVAGHHGSRYSTTEELLQATRPEVAVISAGKDNRYGHPAPDTLERLAEAGAEIYRTDLQGTVVVNSRTGPES